jgi:hypothetical protein
MSIITKFKEKFFPDEEFCFKEVYVYCGQGTDLEKKIKNLDEIMLKLRQGKDLLKVEVRYTSIRYVPFNCLDKYCQEHDFYYHSSQNETSEIRKTIEMNADQLLCDRISVRMKLLDESDPEYFDCKFVKSIIQAKMKIDKLDNCCFCNLS